MASSWLSIGPEALYWGPRHVAKVWNVKEIYITENGCSSSDVPAPDGIVYDSDRVMYLRNYLTQLQRATADGVPVKGYFLWSLMDNFEWADGYRDSKVAITESDGLAVFYFTIPNRSDMVDRNNLVVVSFTGPNGETCNVDNQLQPAAYFTLIKGASTPKASPTASPSKRHRRGG